MALTPGRRQFPTSRLAEPAGPGNCRAANEQRGGVFMTTLERCLDFLDRSRVWYAHTKHSLAFTALDVALAEHLSPHKLAKTVVYAGAQGYGLAVLPADYLINMDT